MFLINFISKNRAKIDIKEKIATFVISASIGISIPAETWKIDWTGSIIPIIIQRINSIWSSTKPNPFLFFNRYKLINATGLIIPISKTYVISVVYTSINESERPAITALIISGNHAINNEIPVIIKKMYIPLDDIWLLKFSVIFFKSILKNATTKPKKLSENKPI